MKKTILFLLGICVFHNSILAAERDSSVRVKGYYIIKYIKSEIEDSYQQKINRLRGESYCTPIDLTSDAYFLPMQINEKKLIYEDPELFNRIITQTISKDSIYYIPNRIYYAEYVKKMFNKEIDLFREISLLQEVIKSYPYYYTPMRSQYLYKCIYIEGRLLHKRIDNNEKNRFSIELDIDAVNRQALYIDTFFLIDITDYTPYNYIKGLTKWYPYLQ